MRFARSCPTFACIDLSLAVALIVIASMANALVGQENRLDVGSDAPSLQVDQGVWINTEAPNTVLELKQGELALVFFQSVW